MSRNLQSFFRRALADQRGQVLPWVTFVMVAVLGMAGLSIDVGHAYVVRNQLQGSANAAALAGAEALPNTTASTQAVTYSSSTTGDKNLYSNLGTVTTTPSLLCLTTLTNLGIQCLAPANANAVKVVQKVGVPTFFMKLFGVSSLTVSATATASWKGSKPLPYNVAVIVDTTLSMNSQDSNCNQTQLACAMNGVEILLNSLSPSIDPVSLFAFPNVTSATVQNDSNCTGWESAGAYAVPAIGATTYSAASNPTYQIVGFSTDYRTSSSAASLNPNSPLVMAVGQLAANGTTTSTTGCLGVPSNAGNYGTYLPGVLYAAQAALVAEHVTNPDGLNVIVLLTDGNSNASNVAVGARNGYGYPNSSMFASGVTAGANYPSYVGDCGQEIKAANYATSQGTRVYTIAYGAMTTGLWVANNVNGSNCPTDQDGFFSTFGLGTNVSAYPNISPCLALQDMASSSQYFFSDYNQSGSNSECYSPNAASPTSLNGIFSAIYSDLTSARLIPNGTT
jgi:Flp pilus assembly protein TadG